MMKFKKVLFLCTGNYYRSRFAEGLFNHLAALSGLGWRAESRGLAIGRTEVVNVGPISVYTLAAFEKRRIAVPEPIPMPRLACLEDFTSADLVIALKEQEHRAMMREYFAEWADRITYWNVHDIDVAPPDRALSEIEQLVSELVARLKSDAVCRPAIAVSPQLQPASPGLAEHTA